MSKTSLLPLFLVLALVVSPSVVGQSAESFLVIVNPSNSLNALSKSEISRLFLKKKHSWPEGGPAEGTVQPIDLSAESSVRQDFSMVIHGRQVSAINANWQRLIFQGRAVPPPTRSSEHDIVAYVAANPHAIGYVSRAAVDRAKVKILTVTD